MKYSKPEQTTSFFNGFLRGVLGVLEYFNGLLGSMVEKDRASDLGLYGMGLCTASLSLCRQTTVLTRSRDGDLLKAVNDVDEVKRQNKFVSFFGKPSREDTETFAQLLREKESGTLVILRKCDALSNKNMSVFAKTLGAKLSRIFRYFLSADRQIEVNDYKLAPIDPLMWDDSRTERFDDSELRVRVPDGEVIVEDSIKIKLAVLPENTAEGERESGFNIKTQGFYILRNNREILDAVSLDVFTKHNSLNRFRGEIQFSGTLDKYLGVNFTKRNIAPWQSLSDQLVQHLKGQVKNIRSRLERAKRSDTPNDVKEVHSDVIDEIRKKSKLLVLPEAAI